MEDTETSALFMALSALVTSLQLAGVMDATPYLLRVAAMAEGQQQAPRIQATLRNHAMTVATQIGELDRSSSKRPPMQ